MAIDSGSGKRRIPVADLAVLTGRSGMEGSSPGRLAARAVDSCVVDYSDSTSSIRAIGAPSPRRCPSLRIRV